MKGAGNNGVFFVGARNGQQQKCQKTKQIRFYCGGKCADSFQEGVHRAYSGQIINERKVKIVLKNEKIGE